MKRTDGDLFVLIIAGILFLLITMSKHNYDVPTAFFFTLALVLLERQQWRTYAILFPLVCLNRETAFLLPLLFGVHFWSRMDRRLYWLLLGYQAVVFAGFRLALMWIFAAAPGSDVYWRPVENLQLYAAAPVTTLYFLLFWAVVFCLVAVRWRQAPALMRTAFALWAPVLFVLYFFVGVSFEIRVFVELLPVVGIIASS